MADIYSAALICENELEALGIKKYSFSVSKGEKSEFNVDGGEFSLFRTLFDTAVSITVFEDDRKGRAATNRLDADSIKQAVLDAHASAEAATVDPAWDIAPKVDLSEDEDGALNGDIDRLFERTRELVENVRERHPKIIIEQLIVSYDKAERLFITSNGTRYHRTVGEYGFELMFSAHDGEESTSFFDTGVSTVSLDVPFIEMGSVERDLSDVEAQLGPKPFEGKEVGVIVLTPGAAESFIGSIIDNFASDGVILSGTSIWKDKVGEKVADERITISADPFHPSVVCGERLTGEGFISEKYDFIKDGILENLCLSLYVANKVGKKRAPCSSFPCIIKPGDETLDEIVSKIKSGIVVGRFSGGDPGTSGDFSGVAKNSFRIEDGKITHPLTEVMISGNLADILNNVVGISSETVSDGSGSIPYMAFGGVTISGK